MAIGRGVGVLEGHKRVAPSGVSPTAGAGSGPHLTVGAMRASASPTRDPRRPILSLPGELASGVAHHDPDSSLVATSCAGGRRSGDRVRPPSARKNLRSPLQFGPAWHPGTSSLEGPRGRPRLLRNPAFRFALAKRRGRLCASLLPGLRSRQRPQGGSPAGSGLRHTGELRSQGELRPRLDGLTIRFGTAPEVGPPGQRKGNPK